MTLSPTLEFSLLKGLEKCKFSDDRISGLPDEILVSILSRLTVKEAARTSIFGCRWENLWKFITILNLDDETLNSSLNRKRKRQVYSKWVTQALKSYHAPTIQDFIVPFDLINTSANDIDNWVHFAFQKRVQNLELDFSSWGGGNQFSNRCYHLKKQPFGLGGFNRLSTLRLKEVGATDEVFEYLFACSPLLEKLSIDSSNEVVNIKITGPSINLKSLEIVLCERLKCIEMSALHLESFTYSGNKISLLFKNVPQLSKVSFLGHYKNRLSHMAGCLSSYLPQLKKLELEFTKEALTRCYLRHVEVLPRLPELSNLRHLALSVVLIDFMVILPRIMFLLDVSPLLHRFTLKVLLSRESIEREEPEPVKKRPLASLKVVELLGFLGDKAELEVAMYLLESAVSLEKLVISLNKLVQFRDSSEFAEEQRLTRECAMKLGAKLPSTAEFVLLQDA